MDATLYGMASCSYQYILTSLYICISVYLRDIMASRRRSVVITVDCHGPVPSHHVTACHTTPAPYHHDAPLTCTPLRGLPLPPITPFMRFHAITRGANTHTFCLPSPRPALPTPVLCDRDMTDTPHIRTCLHLRWLDSCACYHFNCATGLPAILQLHYYYLWPHYPLLPSHALLPYHNLVPPTLVARTTQPPYTPYDIVVGRRLFLFRPCLPPTAAAHLVPTAAGPPHPARAPAICRPFHAACLLVVDNILRQRRSRLPLPACPACRSPYLPTCLPANAAIPSLPHTAIRQRYRDAVDRSNWTLPACHA